MSTCHIPEQPSFSVIGCGRWGTFIAWYLASRSYDPVHLYGRAQSVHYQALVETRQNEYLTLPDAVHMTADLEEALSADVIVISVPSQQLDALGAQIAALMHKPKTFVLCMKGLEASTGRRLSEILRAQIGPDADIAVWIGPGHVQEFVRHVPNCMVIDSDSESVKHRLVELLSGELIRFYYGEDLIGNEIGAAAKNVIGIAAGMLDGLGFTTLKGALMSRGTREIARLIQALGGQEHSAYGLCHLGDYEATVFSPHSHNRRFGELYVQSLPFDKLAEGYYTTQALHTLSQRTCIELPISEVLYAILYEGADATASLDSLFHRSLKREFI